MEKDLVLEGRKGRPPKTWTEQELINALESSRNFLELYNILFNRDKQYKPAAEQRRSLRERIKKAVSSSNNLMLLRAYNNAKYLNQENNKSSNTRKVSNQTNQQKSANNESALNPLLNKEREKELLSALKNTVTTNTTATKEEKKKDHNISNFEKNFVKVLRKKLGEIIPGFNSVIKYGKEGTEKEKSGIKSIGGRELDYDICFELPRNINGYN